VGNIKGRSPFFFQLMDELTTKFGKQHTKLINNVIIRQMNKHQASPTGKSSTKLNVSAHALLTS
jgi:hypothetical protein